MNVIYLPNTVPSLEINQVLGLIVLNSYTVRWRDHEKTLDEICNFIVDAFYEVSLSFIKVALSPTQITVILVYEDKRQELKIFELI